MRKVLEPQNGILRGRHTWHRSNSGSGVEPSGSTVKQPDRGAGEHRTPPPRVEVRDERRRCIAGELLSTLLKHRAQAAPPATRCQRPDIAGGGPRGVARPPTATGRSAAHQEGWHGAGRAPSRWCSATSGASRRTGGGAGKG
eukprot:scaffold17629_cov34-Tisochrysis_lutea.AAC.7